MVWERSRGQEQQVRARGRRADLGTLTPAEARALARSTPLTPAQFKAIGRVAEHRLDSLRVVLNGGAEDGGNAGAGDEAARQRRIEDDDLTQSRLKRG